MPRSKTHILEPDDDADLVFDSLSIAEELAAVNALIASLVSRPDTPLDGGLAPMAVHPPFPPVPELTSLTALEVVRRVVAEFKPGEVVQIGRMEPGGKPLPYTALSVSTSSGETVGQVMSVFRAIADQGCVAYWKLNPYDAAAVLRQSGVRIDERWDGRRLHLKKETWSDVHIARLAFLSGDHDVGRERKAAKTWENALQYEEALARYWWKIQFMAAAPIPTMVQSSGRGFSPIWQLDPPVFYSAQVKIGVQKVLRELLARARGIAVDVGIYTSVNPFIKAPGATHPESGRAAEYSVVDDCQLYTLDDFNEHFSRYRPWQLSGRTSDPYPDDPVVAKRRVVSKASRASYRQYRGPSYAFLEDLEKLLEHWQFDLTHRSNAYFRSFAWHRRNVLWSEVGAAARRIGERLTTEEFTRRVYAQLRTEMEELNHLTGNRIDKSKMDGYLNADFPEKTQNTDKWAQELGVDVALARDLGLKTIVPEEERRARQEAAGREKARRRYSRQLTEKALDEMILSREPYDYSSVTKEQVKYRRKKLIEAGIEVPKRPRGRKKKGKGSPIDSPPPNR